MPHRRRAPRAGALLELQPLRIASQIATLQALFYAVSLVLMLFTALVAGMPFGLDMIIGWEGVRGDTTRGWLLALVWVFDGGFCMSVAIVIFIARSKLVPDFALTIHFLHLVITSLYSGTIPRHYMWWLAMLASAAAATALGIWGCRHRELQSVFFGARAPKPADPPVHEYAASVATVADDDDVDQRAGFLNAYTRGRDHDDAPREFEMVNLRQPA